MDAAADRYMRYDARVIANQTTDTNGRDIAHAEVRDRLVCERYILNPCICGCPAEQTDIVVSSLQHPQAVDRVPFAVECSAERCIGNIVSADGDKAILAPNAFVRAAECCRVYIGAQCVSLCEIESHQLKLVRIRDGR